MEFETIDVYRRPTDQMRADAFTKLLLSTDLHWKHISDIHNLQSTSQSESKSEEAGGAVVMHYAEKYPGEYAS